MPKESGEPVRRRRGRQLETELLDAAWREVVEVGYANLTMESVAARARTAAAVLYRRWPNKEELLIAAMEHYIVSHPIELPDTGTLRGDLFAILCIMGETGVQFWSVVISTAFSGLLANTGLTFTELRGRLLNEKQLSQLQSIFKRAHLRGEIDLARTPSAVLAMPFELVRHDLLMNPRPLKRARIQSILDELLLPLLQTNHHRREQRARRPRT